MSSTRPPIGYHFEWRPEPVSEWSAVPEEVAGHTCTTRGCNNAAVAILFRAVYRRPVKGWRRWFCCPDHMYGREIRDGVVGYPENLVRDEGPR